MLSKETLVGCLSPWLLSEEVLLGVYGIEKHLPIWLLKDREVAPQIENHISKRFLLFLYISISIVLFFCLSRFVCFFLVLCGCCHILLILLLASSQFSSTYSALLIAFETTLKENTTSIIRKVNEKICSCQIISYTYIHIYGIILTIFGHTKLLINLFERVP